MTPSSNPSPAVSRAVRLLRALAVAESGTLTLSELARTLDCAKSSVSNICAALLEENLLERDPSNRGFRLGRGVLELGGAYLSGFDPVQRFHDGIRSLNSARRETLQLAVLEGTEVVYLARHDGEQRIKIWSSIGARLPASCTATGKVLLAGLDPGQIEVLYRNVKLPRPTRRAVQSVRRLAGELQRIREQGYSIDDEEATEGVVCIGVGVPRSASSDPLIALSATILKGRDGPALREGLLADLQLLAGSLNGSSMGAHEAP